MSAAVVAAALRAFEAEVNKRGWDKPPLLGYLGRVPHPAATPALALVTGQLPVVFSVTPSAVLRGLVGMNPDRRAKLLGLVHGKLYGLLLCCEAWGASAALGTEQASELAVDGYQRRIRARADRVEVRFVAAVTNDGDRWYLERERGHEPHLYPAEQRYTESAVFECLEDLLKVCNP